MYLDNKTIKNCKEVITRRAKMVSYGEWVGRDEDWVQRGALGWLAKIFLDVVMVISTRVLDLDYFTKTYVCSM